MLRRILFAAFAAVVVAGVGCVNQYASDPVTRTDQLINESENYRQIGEFWRRFWFNDQPSHLTVERIHGGIM